MDCFQSNTRDCWSRTFLCFSRLDNTNIYVDLSLKNITIIKVFAYKYLYYSIKIHHVFLLFILFHSIIVLLLVSDYKSSSIHLGKTSLLISLQNLFQFKFDQLYFQQFQSFYAFFIIFIRFLLLSFLLYIPNFLSKIKVVFSYNLRMRGHYYF